MHSAPEDGVVRGFCVIMAGGRGTRFWPLSRARSPKQLLPLGQGPSLLRETFDRLAPVVGVDRILVVTTREQAEATARALPELDSSRIVAEPSGRNTAPCAVLGAGLAAMIGGPGPVALLPADHWIPDPDRFRDQLRRAFALAAAEGGAVTFGIPPTHPATGYGYLECGDAAADGTRPGLRFVEKPDAATARAFLADGRFYWNSGMFVWDGEAFAAAAAAHAPATVAALAPALAAHGGPDFDAALDAAYAACPAESVDVAIMEKLAAFTVLPADFRWSDLGSWDAWGELAPVLADDNRGRSRIYPVDSRGNVVFAPDKSVALVGVEGLVIVDTPDALLVCRADEAQRLREVIDRLEADEREDLL